MPKRRSDASGDSCTRRKRCGLISVIWEKEKTALKGGGRKMKKSIAFLVTAFLLLSCVAMAYAQPLEELVVDVVAR